jgi:hypothetical protein
MESHICVSVCLSFGVFNLLTYSIDFDEIWYLVHKLKVFGLKFGPYRLHTRNVLGQEWTNYDIPKKIVLLTAILRYC